MMGMMQRMRQPHQNINLQEDANARYQEPAVINNLWCLEDYGDPHAIATNSRIYTKDARILYIYDQKFKLQQSDVYDIGGTYSNEMRDIMEEGALVHNEIRSPELWFFFTATTCPGNNYLLNLFVCIRNPGNYSIGVSSSNEIQKRRISDKTTYAMLGSTLTWNTFKCIKDDQNFHIKTFCFKEKDMSFIEHSTLAIPIQIVRSAAHCLANDVMKNIKLNHDFGDILSRQEKTDFVLISASDKQYPVHKIFLAAHSPVLRNMVKSKTTEQHHHLPDVDDSEMELLLEFIYTGTIKEIMQKDCVKLLQIADRFKLNNLFSLTQYALGEQINVDNAVEIAVIADKYNLEKLEMRVFNYIKNYYQVLESEGWKNLKDVNLAKKLFKTMHSKRA